MARITVEDCLKKENNRFALVRMATRRAKDLLNGAPALTDTEGNKEIVVALREIAAGKVTRILPIDENQKSIASSKIEISHNGQAKEDSNS